MRSSGSISPAHEVKQRARLHGVVSQEPEMSNGRPNLLFFGLIAASLCAAAVLIGLLVTDDVAGSKVAMNHSPPHSKSVAVDDLRAAFTDAKKARDEPGPFASSYFCCWLFE
jgi:hypothetical protein